MARRAAKAAEAPRQDPRPRGRKGRSRRGKPDQRGPKAGVPGIAPGAAHVVSVGIAPVGEGGGVIEALVADIKPLKADLVVAVGSAAARPNADLLFAGLNLDPARAEFVQLSKVDHLDAIYREVSDVVSGLEARGYSPKRIVVHFTAGTKVMSAAMVLAAVSHGCERLRYLAWQGEGEPSKSVAAAPRAFRAAGDVRLAETLLREMRFRSAADVLAQVNEELLTREERSRVKALRGLAQAYSSWDNFRTRDFLKAHRAVGRVPATLSEFALSREAAASLRRIVDAERSEGVYPVELIYDLYNNAVRRLAERRTDDALTRLYRSAELFAQRLLSERHKIRTEDVDIRKVPPRHRFEFEAVRRLDDVKIKLGLRKSFDLLAYLEDPVGLAFQNSTRLQEVLSERRRLVLAHGVMSAPALLALDFIREFGALLAIELPRWREDAARQQFPWIDNERVLADVAASPDDSAAVAFGRKDAP